MATGDPPKGMIWDDTLGWMLPTDPVSYALARTILETRHTWQTIQEKPPAPLQAELFYADLYLIDKDGNRVTAIIEPYRDERRQMGYWDGECWRHCGTGHEVFEFGDTPQEWLPTHWRELPPVPSNNDI